MKDVRLRLREIRRRLGPYSSTWGNEPFRVNDAQIAGAVAELILIVEQLVERVEKIGADDGR